ncbi:MAG: molybdopterin-guanine dinucleotide biosynthesis protein MobB [Thermodesulfobacteriota bacterium]|nr:molybdopterin-guanine dinucleotide biosynthesis protein MobB [Thermodesulfobacteriota bacterium]
MKVFGITGFKKSGKTTLGVRLSQELSKMGLSVGILKHVPGDINLPDTDTSKYGLHADFVCAVSSIESEMIVKGKRSIEDILAYFDCDIVLVEGFKKKKTFPKIVCIRDKAEENDLFDGLQLATASFKENIADFNIMDDDHVKKMAAIVIERSFKLPDLDCGHCGYESCYELAKEIVSGNETIDSCVSLNPLISVKIDGDDMPLNPFLSDLFKNIILSMVSPLRGSKKGKIQIEI